MTGITESKCGVECTYWVDASGLLHRDDGPAMMFDDGTQQWYQHGVLHREDGPAEIYNNNLKLWKKNGRHHRIGAPAVIHRDMSTEWWVNGKMHRLDGPAVEYSDGETRYWYVNGTKVIEDQHLFETEEGRLMLVMKYGLPA